MSRLHQAEARARFDRRLTGWLGSRDRMHGADRRLSRAIVAAEIEAFEGYVCRCDWECARCPIHEAAA